MGILSMMGLMTVEASNKLVNEAKADLQRRLTDEEAAGTRTALDLSSARASLTNAEATVERQTEALAAAEKIIAARDAEIAGLKPDAEAMRAKRKRDVEQKAEKRKAAAAPAPKPVAAKVKRGAK